MSRSEKSVVTTRSGRTSRAAKWFNSPVSHTGATPDNESEDDQSITSLYDNEKKSPPNCPNKNSTPRDPPRKRVSPENSPPKSIEQDIDRTTLNQQESEEEEEEDPDSIDEFLIEIREKMKAMLQDPDNEISESSKQIIKRVQKLLAKSQETHRRVEKKVKKLEQKLMIQTNRNDDLNDALERIAPTKKWIYEAVQDIVEKTEQRASKRQTSTARESVTGEQDEAHQQTTAGKHTKPVTIQQQQNTSKNEPEPSHRRTLIIRPTPAKVNSITGRDINTKLNEQQVSCPANTVKHIQIKRRSVEILCVSEQARDNLQRTLQTNQILNRDLSFMRQPTPLQKVKLLGVPPHHTAQSLEDSLKSYLALRPEEIKIFGSRPGRYTDNNWLLLLPSQHAKTIIQDGGIVIGMKKCILRPHTEIIRCRNCQSLTHPTRFCPREKICEGCGQSHGDEECNNSPSCINCTYDNERNGNHNNVNHKASDPNCPVYRAIYTEERERLDKEYGLNQDDLTATIPPFQYQQQFFPQLPVPWRNRPFMQSHHQQHWGSNPR